ncbi:MAG: hypothetical protein ABSB40_11975 [Nitrososphaeria archaeon]|jgi:hypothetical protein
MNANEKFLLEMEKRFKATCDVSPFPLQTKKANVETNKDKSKEFSEVFTPLWLVDQMIKQVDFDSCDTTTLDLCAGYGQFSIRLMRYFYNNFPYWDVKKFLINNHAFSELQLSSCYKLLNIFSNKITLFIGDSTHLNKLPANAKGLWCYIENYGYWVCLTKTIQGILSSNGIKEKPCSEAQFVSSVETIIKDLNETYTTMEENFLKQLTNSKLRLELIDQLNERVKIIPPNLVSEMLDQVEDLEKKTILVLYNCEIVEQLIHKKKIDPKTITFGSELGFLHNTFKGRKFDVCLSNPPYNRGLDLKILQALMNNGTVETSIAKKFIWVHPSTWLLDQKGKANTYNNVKALLNKKLRSVKIFNGNAVFGIELFVPCVISHIDCEYDNTKTKVLLFEENFTVNSIADITKFGVNWKTIVEPFIVKMEKFIQTSGHIWSHNTRTIDPTKTYCQTAAIRGNVNDRNKKSNATNATKEIVKDNFYTMLKGRDIEECKGIRETRLNKPGGATPTFGFDTVAERDNFLNYLNTDFARFCLSIYKIGQHMENGEMELIPWLDFTQTWDDKKLFDHFDINKDTQDYIRKFLPDYYGIRK